MTSLFRSPWHNALRRMRDILPLVYRANIGRDLAHRDAARRSDWRRQTRKQNLLNRYMSPGIIGHSGS